MCLVATLQAPNLALGYPTRCRGSSLAQTAIGQARHHRDSIQASGLNVVTAAIVLWNNGAARSRRCQRQHSATTSR